MNYRLLDRGETMQQGDEALTSTEPEKWEPIPHWIIGMPYRPSNSPARRLLDVSLDAESVIERLQARIEHSDYYNGVRYARLWHWAHEELSETLKSRFFCIVANGTADHMESPTYAQQINSMRHRAERAETELAKLRGTDGVATGYDGVTTHPEFGRNAGVAPSHEPEPRMAFCPACFVEVSAAEADQQTLDARKWREHVAGVPASGEAERYEAVGTFMEDGGRWLKMDAIYANDADAVTLYRRADGVPVAGEAPPSDAAILAIASSVGMPSSTGADTLTLFARALLAACAPRGVMASEPIRRIEPQTPHRCIKPQCPIDCSMCNHAIPGDDAALVLIADLLDGLAVDGFDGPMEDGESALVDRARKFLAAGRRTAGVPAVAPSDAELLEMARDEATIYGEGVTMLDLDTMLRVLRAVARRFPAGVGGNDGR